MKPVLVSCLFIMMFPALVWAETASEVPLENPEILKPAERPQGVSPEPGHREKKVSPREMTASRLAEIIIALDSSATVSPRSMRLTIEGVALSVVIDPLANRMRAFAPFRTLDGVDGQTLYRMMQANFDSALDARYAVAKGHVISAFIHPLKELQKEQFIEGVGQVVNLVKTFGTAFTSGAVTYGGGDSNALHRQLIDELLKKGEDI